MLFLKHQSSIRVSECQRIEGGEVARCTRATVAFQGEGLEVLIVASLSQFPAGVLKNLKPFGGQ
jgi:hypothetical protein